MRETVQVQMLGGFSIRLGNGEITDNDNHAKKVWLLLAYLIYHRNRHITQEELMDVLWQGEMSSANPLNALKTMFYRARILLNQLGNSSGYSLIVRRDGTYAWNNEVPVSVDAEEFGALLERIRQGEANNSHILTEAGLQAAALYHGDFLPKLSADPWVSALSIDYHSMYLGLVQQLLPALEESERLEEAASLCQEAVRIEPFDEQFYLHFLRLLIQLGERQKAVKIYEDMSQMMFDTMGVVPPDELRALYREAIETINQRVVNIEDVREQLQEHNAPKGAMICDYDFFRALYQLEAREMSRSGSAVHIALLSVVSNTDGTELPRRSLDRCVRNLQDVIRTNLRRGDAAALCSVSQYVLLLPRASYEDSQRICSRIIRSFNRIYPHSPAAVRAVVQPVQPLL